MEIANHTESMAAAKSPSSQSNQNDDVGLLPYVNIGGEWSIPANVLKQYFNQMAKEGTHKLVFPTGNIQTADQFVVFCQNQLNINTFIINGKHIGGHSWINAIEDGRCLVHFSALQWVRGAIAVKLGMGMSNGWFSLRGSDGEPLIDMQMGLIPSRNKSALRFVERLGFTRLDPPVPLMIKNFYEGDRDSVVIHYRLRDGRS